MRLSVCATVLLLVSAFAVTHAQSPSEEAGQSRKVNVAIQLVNPDAQTAIRVLLDGKLILDGFAEPSSLNIYPTKPAVAGPFALVSRNKHAIVAEVRDANTKARLEWSPRLDASAWVVIHYYPGRGVPATPPIFTFALQADAHKVR